MANTARMRLTFMTRGPVLLPIVILMSASFVLAPSSALNPLDDDAGAAGDAGDVALLATPVNPGTFEARLGAPHDTQDWYSFEGAAGDRITYRVSSDANGAWPLVGLHGPRASTTPTGDLYMIAHGNAFPGEFVLPLSGTWYLNAFVNADETSPIRYTIDLGRTALDGVVVGSATAPSFGLELRMNEPSDVWVWVRASNTEIQAGAPRATTQIRDFTISSPESPFSSATGAIRVSRTDVGDQWRVDEIGLDGGLPLEVTASREAGWVQSTLHMTDTAGWLRVANYFTDHVGRQDYVVWTSGDVEWAADTGPAPTSYRTADLEGAEVVVPGVGLPGARSLAVELPDRTIGWADGGDAVIEATAPDGTVYASAPSHDWMPFYHPEVGGWSLGFQPTVQLAQEADRIWFDHVQVPELGLAGEPFIRLPHGPSW